MNIRYLIVFFLLTGSFLVSGPASADDMLAKVDTRMPLSSQFQEPEPSLTVNKVLVRKQERRLYLMDGDQVVKSYRISLGDNPKGHKLYEGDERTPEGDYTLDWRNAGSDFYKSIHISYPSAKDRELAHAWGLNPGGSIMIHGLPNQAGDMAFAYQGLDWTNGCIAVTNDEIDEIWNLVANGTPIRIVP